MKQDFVPLWSKGLLRRGGTKALSAGRGRKLFNTSPSPLQRRISKVPRYCARKVGLLPDIGSGERLVIR
mgnify:CR=1 FL=1